MTIARNLGIGLVSALCLAGIGAAASAQDGPQSPAPGRQCTVSVDRSQDAGVFNVTRQELSNGDCVCYVYTGPTSQGAAVEARISELVQSRQCGSARVAQVPQNAPGGTGALVAGEGLLIAGVIASGAGLIALLDNSEGGDPLPVSP